MSTSQGATTVSPSRFKPYPEYKDSGVEWLGEIPEGWDVNKLGNYIIHERPSEFSGKREYCCTADIDDGLASPSEFVDFLNRPTRADILVRKGDVIQAKMKGTEKAFIIPKSMDKMLVSTGFIQLRDEKLSDYLYYWVKSKKFLEFRDLYSVGSTQKAANTKALASSKVPSPPVIECKKIVTYLNSEVKKSNILISKQYRAIELLKERRSTLITQTVTKGLDPNVPMKDSDILWIGEIPAHWDTPQLGHCLTMITYGFTCPMPSTDDGPYMLTANDIRDGFVDYQKARRTDSIAAAQLTDKCRPRRGDVLLTKDGTLGRVAVADGSPTCINQSVALLRANGKRMSSSFLSWLLRCSAYQDWMVFDAGGTTIKHLYITRVTKMTALVPPLDEQDAVVARANMLDSTFSRAIAAVETQIDRLREYRSALISAAVTGKIDVREAA